MRLRGGLCFSVFFREPGTAKQILLEGDTLEWAVGRGRPTPQLPTPGRKWGWRSRLEKLLIAAGPFGLVPDSGCLSPPSTSGRDGNPGLSRLRPPPVRDQTVPSGV